MAFKTDNADRSTPKRLLEAACKVFASKGFRDATIAEISEEAGANIAAVNYHFRDKENLYVEAWKLGLERSLKAHPPDGGVPADAPPEERLRGRILAVMQRLGDSSNCEFEIIHRELANPTGLLALVARESIEPLRRDLGAIVRELLGTKATEEQVELCRMSIMAQCLHPMIRHRHRKMFATKGEETSEGLQFEVEVLVDHITQFSLAGIRDLRRKIEGEGTGYQG